MFPPPTSAGGESVSVGSTRKENVSLAVPSSQISDFVLKYEIYSVYCAAGDLRGMLDVG